MSSAAAGVHYSGVARYELQDGKSAKFWEIELDGNSFSVRYGRLGTDGQTSTKTYPDAERAQKEHDKLVASKVRKGYQPVHAESEPSEPPGPEPGHPELEAAIHENPSDLEAWQVYGDWLQTQGDPRGEVLALDVAAEQADDPRPKEQWAAQAKELASGLVDRWLPKDLVAATQGNRPCLVLTWRFGFLESVTARVDYDHEGPSVEQMLKGVMKSSASRFLHEIRIGLTDAEGETTFRREVLAIAKQGRRPSVRRVYVGDFEYPDETEISWTDVGSVEELYAVFPNLEGLKIQGGGISLGKVAHPKLRTLILHTGGLPSEAAGSVAKATLPALEELEIWFGSDDYGGDSSIDLLDPLFQATGFPRLRSLGLMNSEFADELPEALAHSKLLSQLESLDLSMGTMTDDGARILLEHKKAFSHLQRLSVDDNGLSESMVEQLTDGFGTILYSRGQKQFEEDWRYASVGE